MRSDRSRRSGNDAIFFAVKGWFWACVTATAILFIYGLTNTTVNTPGGLTPSLLLTGLLASIVHLTVIALFTTVPAAIFIWIVDKLNSQYLLIFAGFGGLLGWLANHLANPLNHQEILLLYISAGVVAGAVYWFVAEERDRDTSLR